MVKSRSKETWQRFLELCAKINHPTEFGRFLDLFLTHEEKEIITSRYLIVKSLLEEELTQREIAGMYNVSIAQITRGSNALKIVDSKLKKSLKSLLNEELKAHSKSEKTNPSH